MKRGDVVIVDWPVTRPGSLAKARPALVIRNDKDNSRLTNTIVAMITSVTRRSNEPTQVPIDISTADGKATGLRQDSVVNCINLLTVEQNRILHVIGHFSAALMTQINGSLKVTLELP